MKNAPRAVLLDLDDTLYPERRFALSGFRHVARVVSSSSIETDRAFSILAGCLRRGERTTALQTLCQTVGYPVDSIPALVDVFRRHVPVLKLPRGSAQILAELHGTWRLAIVTNGYPDIQRRKIAALGLESLVDAVICASEHGRGIGKPDPEPFLEASARLSVEPTQCVFVGDDPQRDIAGARAVGMRTIRVRRGAYRSLHLASATEADAVTTSIRDVPRLAAALLAATRTEKRPDKRAETSSRCA